MDYQDKDIIFKVALTRISGVGSEMYRTLIEQFASAQAVFASDEAHLLAVKGVGTRLAAAILSPDDAMDEAYRITKSCREKKIEIISISDPRYPRRMLATRRDAPPILYTKGTATLNPAKAVAVVGTRQMTDYGRTFCTELISQLALSHPEIQIISGLALGVDVAAHRAALDYELETVAVMGTSHEAIYPRENRPTALDIVDHGALVSEFAFGDGVHRANFVTRNRTIAAMSDLVIVVESSADGGSLRTADYARAFGVPVCALVGDRDREMSVGCNELIKRGHAHLITSPQDVEHLLGYVSQTKQQAPVDLASQTTKLENKSAAPTVNMLNISDDARPIVELLLAHGAMHKDDLTLSLSMSASALTDILFDLELDDVVRTLPGNIIDLKR